MSNQQEEYKQMALEAEIRKTLDKLYDLLQQSDSMEAETQLGYVAQFKVYWEDGIPMSEQGE